MKSLLTKPRLLALSTGLGLYLISTGLSYTAFSYLRTSPQITAPQPVSPTAGLLIPADAPRDQECPLNGKMFTKIEREAWEQRRPLAIMIENHLDSRPQSGLSEADLVYETVAEGGITRFLALFFCDVVAKETQIGPVRSARIYYLDLASEYGETPLYVHVGGSNNLDGLTHPKAQALETIQKYGWALENDINQFSVGYPTFWRDYERLGRPTATEHTVYTTSEKLWQLAKNRGWTNLDPDGLNWQDNFTPFKFTDEADGADRGSNNKLTFDFWDGYSQYQVIWDYDAATNEYRRTNGGEPHLDFNTKEPLKAKNVVIQFTKETGPVDEHKHMLYDIIGDGAALIFQNGDVVKANWKKTSRTARTLFTATNGKPVEFVRGSIWIEIVPRGNSVDY